MVFLKGIMKVTIRTKYGTIQRKYFFKIEREREKADNHIVKYFKLKKKKHVGLYQQYK